MYQSIEDEPPHEAEGESGIHRGLLYGGGAAAAGFVLLVVLWMLGGSPTSGTSDPISPDPAARTAYLQALGESDPALRRARLTDFLDQYPDTPRDGAVRAQLAILDAAADRDWQATLTLAYDPRVSLDDRRRAVDAYQTEWGRYLGARDAEIQMLLAEIETVPTLETLPDRSLPRDPELYRGIPDDRLAGDQFGRDRGVIFRSSEDLRSPVFKPREDVVGVRVRRNATPRYPARAERRGVEAIVTLALTVDEDGRVSTVDVVDIEADRYERDFLRAAERAALRTRFDPRTIGGVPVETTGIVKRYRFELDR